MKLRCLFPFTFLEFHSRGQVFCCCPNWTKMGPIGNLLEKKIEDIWNSPKVQYIRKKIYQNNLSEICNRDYCPIAQRNQNIDLEKLYKKKAIAPKLFSQIKKKATQLTTLPQEISIADSGECNLRCKMCFSNASFIKTNKKLTKIIFSQTLPKLIPHLWFIKLSGNGDPFFRRETRQFLQNFRSDKYSKVQFKILTNALLLNNKMWQGIKHNKFWDVSVSIDAASKKTYEKIRIGGNWEKLQKNLKLLSKLRKSGGIKNFNISMVVMKSNYQEMKKFVQMGEELNCDSIYFQRIFGVKKVLEENVNPKILKEIKTILQDPIFNKPYVSLNNIKDYKNFQQDLLAWVKYYLQLYFYKLAFFIYANKKVKKLWKKFKYKTTENKI